MIPDSTGMLRGLLRSRSARRFLPSVTFLTALERVAVAFTATLVLVAVLAPAGTALQWPG
jgi:hypothetical protein